MLGVVGLAILVGVAVCVRAGWLRELIPPLIVAAIIWLVAVVVRRLDFGDRRGKEDDTEPDATH